MIWYCPYNEFTADLKTNNKVKRKLDYLLIERKYKIFVRPFCYIIPQKSRWHIDIYLYKNGKQLPLDGNYKLEYRDWELKISFLPNSEIVPIERVKYNFTIKLYKYNKMDDSFKYYTQLTSTEFNILTRAFYLEENVKETKSEPVFSPLNMF